MPCKLRLLALLAKAVLAPQSTYAVGSGGEGGAVGCLPVLMVCVCARGWEGGGRQGGMTALPCAVLLPACSQSLAAYVKGR